MNAKLNISRIARNYGTLFAYIIMLLVFSILAPSAFPTLSNVISILRQIAMLATISLGLTFVLITKRSDLSIGYSTSFLGIVAVSYTHLDVYKRQPLLPPLLRHKRDASG